MREVSEAPRLAGLEAAPLWVTLTLLAVGALAQLIRVL